MKTIKRRTKLGAIRRTKRGGGLFSDLASPKEKKRARIREKAEKSTHKIFDLLEWHDSYVFWHMTKEYRKKNGVLVNDIGYAKGVKGHHVFVNSELGQYIDHFKGDRKETQRSTADDIRKTPELSNVDYWKDVK